MSWTWEQTLNYRWDSVDDLRERIRPIIEAQAEELERLKEEKASCERVMFRIEQEKQEARNQLREAEEGLAQIANDGIDDVPSHIYKSIARRTLSHIQGKE